MELNVDAILKLIPQLGLFVIATGALWWAVLTPRKDGDGKRTRPPLLVPGWHYERGIADADRRCHLAEARVQEAERDWVSRQSEWRRLRDEERARAAEADLRLSASTAVLRELVTVVGEARIEVARLAGVASVKTGGGEGDG